MQKNAKRSRNLRTNFSKLGSSGIVEIVLTIQFENRGGNVFFPVETRDVKIINHFSKCSELSAKECKNQGACRSEPSLSFQIRGILTISPPLLFSQPPVVGVGGAKAPSAPPPTTALQMKLDDSRVSKNKRYLRRKYSEPMHCSQTHKFHAPTLFIRQDFSIC